MDETYEINEGVVSEVSEEETQATELNESSEVMNWIKVLGSAAAIGIAGGIGLAQGVNIGNGMISLGEKIGNSKPVSAVKNFFTKPRPKKVKKGEVIEADFTEAGDEPVEEISEEPKKGSRTRVKKG